MIGIRICKELKGPDGKVNLSIDINIKRGEFLAIYGPSGAGKTSLLRMVAGLMPPDQAKINIDDIYWAHTEKSIQLPARKRKTGFVFQEPGLFPNMTVKKNLHYALEKGVSRKIVEQVIKDMNLEGLTSFKPAMLSGGQQQKVALARALIRQPELLLLDEPLSSMDTKLRREMQDHIRKVHDRYHLTTMLVSHDPAEIIRLADRVLFLEDGKISKEGKPSDVFGHQKVSGKFQFTGEILKIEKEDVIYIVSVLIGNQIARVVAVESEVRQLSPGDNVMVASKAFNPVIQKISS